MKNGLIHYEEGEWLGKYSDFLYKCGEIAPISIGLPVYKAMYREPIFHHVNLRFPGRPIL